ncbi:MAG: cupin domain-containing protein [Desulfovibrio desulfuricans]|nr:cupin domain-containing protein [Desulfovibrio desulfuricans]
MQRLLKNLDYATALPLAAQVDCQPGQVASKTLVQNDAVGITLFAFDKGEKISAHTSTGDAFVLALEGQGQVTINGQTSPLKAGESIIMPAGQPHSVSAVERFKMLLIVIFPPE